MIIWWTEGRGRGGGGERRGEKGKGEEEGEEGRERFGRGGVIGKGGDWGSRRLGVSVFFNEKETTEI